MAIKQWNATPSLPKLITKTKHIFAPSNNLGTQFSRGIAALHTVGSTLLRLVWAKNVIQRIS
jgi:hypothetical protein